MRNWAVLLAVWTWITGVTVCRADGNYVAPLPLTQPTSAVIKECEDCGSAKHNWAGWFCYRPLRNNACCSKCCGCSCCCGQLYGFFLCTPWPTAHVGDGHYIGQGQPPMPYASCRASCSQ